jgi:hypothetical protein
MLRALVVALLLSGWTLGAAAEGPPVRRVVDLDAPGAFEAIQTSNPTHYDKIRRILQGVLQQPEARVAQWMLTTFDARDVAYVPVVLTSQPPQRRLAFALDATRYEVTLVLTNVRGEVVPAR